MVFIRDSILLSLKESASIIKPTHIHELVFRIITHCQSTIVVVGQNYKIWHILEFFIMLILYYRLPVLSSEWMIETFLAFNDTKINRILNIYALLWFTSTGAENTYDFDCNSDAEARTWYYNSHGYYPSNVELDRTKRKCNEINNKPSSTNHYAIIGGSSAGLAVIIVVLCVIRW